MVYTFPPNSPAAGASIPDGVTPSVFQSGDIEFLSGTPGAPPAFTDFSGAEQNLFDADLRKAAWLQSLERDLSQLLLSQRDALLYSGCIAKNQLPLKAFGGILKASGLNMMHIRPVTILGGVLAKDGGGGAAFVGTWKRSFAATGWQALFGSNANADPVSLGVTGTATTALTTYNSVVVSSPYIISTGSTPRFVELKWFVQNTSYPVYPVHWLPITDLYAIKLPGILLALMNQQFAVEANIGTTGDDVPQLYGLQWVVQQYAVNET